MLLIKNATVSSCRNNDKECVHIVVDGAKIADVVRGEMPSCDFDKIIDADQLLVLPGAIDPHVHFDTPGYTEREDFIHGSQAAAAGGVTCVIDMPDTSIPPVTDRAKFNAKLKIIDEMSVVDYALWGGVSGNSFRANSWQRSMQGLRDVGVVGFKTYLLSGMHTFDHLFPLELVEVMRHAGDMGVLVGLHAEDRDLVQTRSAVLRTAGRFDPKAYYESRCDPAELNGIRQGVAIASETGCALHIVHVGSSEGAKHAIYSRKNGADITLETCIHFLEFSNDDLIERGSIVKTAPVVKTKKDSDTLWKLISSGGIDYLASDHAPCSEAEKNTGSIWTDYSGMPGTELMLPYIFSEGYSKGRLTLSRLIDVTSMAASRRYGLDYRKGRIEKGFDADFVFVDPDRKWIVEGRNLHSKGRMTPFEGREFTGKIVRTICRGNTIYEEVGGITTKPGFGEFIKRGPS
ncbi:MAG: allantoinase AllB [Deltaproteobacteria bacterium]|jgi:allantoinase|nr:allantoinase AllB [Deltaproteobacteria bacterium]